jgi:hypothetical protein
MLAFLRHFVLLIYLRARILIAERLLGRMARTYHPTPCIKKFAAAEHGAFPLN